MAYTNIETTHDAPSASKSRIVRLHLPSCLLRFLSQLLLTLIMFFNSIDFQLMRQSIMLGTYGPLVCKSNKCPIGLCLDILCQFHPAKSMTFQSHRQNLFFWTIAVYTATIEQAVHSMYHLVEHGAKKLVHALLRPWYTRIWSYYLHQDIPGAPSIGLGTAKAICSVRRPCHRCEWPQSTAETVVVENDEEVRKIESLYCHYCL